MKYKWFWITSVTWFALGGISSWALIFSPINIHPQKTIHLEPEINGQKQIDDIFVSSDSLEDCLIETTRLWEKEGWKCTNEGRNIAALLLGAQSDNSILSAYVHIDMFEKGGRCRIIGLLKNQKDRKTYECISEFPISTLSSKACLDHWDFPLKPSPESFHLFCFNYNGRQLASWAQSTHKNGEQLFRSLFSNQGFSENLLSEQRGEAVYILQKKSIRLIAITREDDKKVTISLVKLSQT